MNFRVLIKQMINYEGSDLYAMIRLSEKLIKRTNSTKINFVPFVNFTIYSDIWNFSCEKIQRKSISLLYKILV